jgi:glyoxylate carboligase
MAENSCIVQWVQQSQERRISSYRWALERLVIQAPDGIAADADRLIKELATLAANPPVMPSMAGCAAVTVKG